MTEKLTRIRLPGLPNRDGIMDWGEQPIASMITLLRTKAQRELEAATAILNAEDHEFQIDVIRGSAVQHHVKTLQESSRKESQ